MPGGMPAHSTHAAHAARGHATLRHRALGGSNHIVNTQDHDRSFCSRGDGLGLDTERLDNAGCFHVDCLAFEYVQAVGLLALLVGCADLDEHVDGVKPCILCEGARDDFEG